MWKCPSVISCVAIYETLYELISHLRSAHSHESIRIICDVEPDCQQLFITPNAWYWHVRKYHYNVYGIGKRKRFATDSYGLGDVAGNTSSGNDDCDEIKGFDSGADDDHGHDEDCMGCHDVANLCS